LIGRTLVEKSSTPMQLVLTDREAVLDLRWKLDVPVVWLGPDGSRAHVVVRRAGAHELALACHPRFADDPARVSALIDRLDSSLDLAEPFGRVREAIGEARKMGAGAR
jgi:hypothetical protein